MQNRLLIQTILEAAGSGLENVLNVNAYVTYLTRFAEFNEVYKEFFSHDPPARTIVATGLLGVLVEVYRGSTQSLPARAGVSAESRSQKIPPGRGRSPRLRNGT